jgi:hypothetical protein
LLNRHVKSRSKRCLKNSTSFGIKKEGLTTLYFSKEVPQGLISKAIEQARQVAAREVQKMSKRSGRHSCSISVLLPTYPDTSFWVTSYTFSWKQKLLSLIRPTPAKRAWVNSHSLLVRDIATLKPVALYEEKNLLGVKSGYLVTKATVNREPVDQYFIENLLSLTGGALFHRRCRFIRQFAQSILQLYQRQIFFPLLRTEDIFVEETAEDSWCFYFSHDSKIVFNRRASLQEQRRNLLQLYEYLDAAVGNRDRMRFLFAFTQVLARSERKAFIRKVVHEASLNDAATIKQG